MIVLAEKELCSGCMACAEVCPQNAIKAYCDEKGFVYPQINTEKCIQCGICMKMCPVLQEGKRTEIPLAGYAAYSRDVAGRKKSTSGGILSEVAAYVIGQGGCVYGAAFNDKYGVEHIGIEQLDELDKIRGSKYVQSNAFQVYSEVKTNLDKGRRVLFVGTPCQTGGLSRYLEKNYDNLTLVDFICFGTGSPKVWEKYLDAFWDVRNIASIFFKDKKYGWDRWHFAVQRKNGRIYRERGKKNLYMAGYLDGMYLRPSCYNCQFKGNNHMSDITIADCWGIDMLCSDFNDNHGVSAVLIRSSKGKAVFEEIKKRIVYQFIEPEKLFSHNPYAFQNAPQNSNTQFFYEELKNNVSNAFFQYCSGGRMKYYFEKYFFCYVRRLVYLIRNRKARWM